MLDFDRFKLVSFDCYGTLIDWEKGILTAVRSVLDNHGVEAADEAILERYALTEAKHEVGEYYRYELILKMVMAELSLRLGFDATTDEVMSMPASVKDWKPFPDTNGALRRFKTKYKLAVISNVDDRLFEATARHLEVAFDWVVTAQQARSYKPSQKTFEYAFGKFGVPREQILHVAQSVYHDVVPAKALGVATVWVNRRHSAKGGGATPPASATADLEVKSLAELADVMGL